jgi:hypothetical protein
MNSDKKQTGSRKRKIENESKDAKASKMAKQDQEPDEKGRDVFSWSGVGTCLLCKTRKRFCHDDLRLPANCFLKDGDEEADLALCEELFAICSECHTGNVKIDHKSWPVRHATLWYVMAHGARVMGESAFQDKLLAGITKLTEEVSRIAAATRAIASPLRLAEQHLEDVRKRDWDT